MFRRSAVEMRVLILAPVGRDARLLADTVEALEIETACCDNAEALITMVEEGAGAAIVAEEALHSSHILLLAKWLESQPPWSDLPFVILSSGGGATPATKARAQRLRTLGNATLLERPVRPETVQSSVRAALRARMRQYEMRSRQEALIRANADLEQFAHSASHDLREPIRSIAIYSELLSMHYGKVLDQRGNEHLNLVRSAAIRMDTLVNDLLSYAHAASIPERPPEPASAKGPLEAALKNLAAAIQESGSCISAGDMPLVRMLPSHLQQLFQNLIGNAIKYRREEKLQVRVAAAKADGHWVFSVEDNGIGIPAEYHEMVFGIFKRLHSGQSYSGTGMGLAICQRIVEQYGGRIWVESEPGRGSIFRFTIRE